MAHTQTYFDLLDACKTEECPVCRLATAGLHRYFASVDYEMAADFGYRAKLPPAHGYCNEHTAWWLRQGHVLATAEIYAEVLPYISDELKRLQFRRRGFRETVGGLLGGGESPADRTSSILTPSQPCPACRFVVETEAMAIKTLLDGLTEPDFRAAYVASPGLCVRHLRQALAAVSSAEAFAMLRDHAIASNERLIAQLQEIVRKQDYRFHDEPSGEERGAARRAAIRVAAAHGVYSGRDSG